MFCVLSRFSRVLLFVTPWTIAFQVSLSMGFLRQEYWSWLPCPPPGDRLDPGVKPVSLVSCTVSEFFTTSAAWEEKYIETRDSGRTELHSSLHKMRGSISVITNGITEPRSPSMSKVLLKGLRGLLSSTVTALTRKKKKNAACTCLHLFHFLQFIFIEHFLVPRIFLAGEDTEMIKADQSPSQSLLSSFFKGLHS